MKPVARLKENLQFKKKDREKRLPIKEGKSGQYQTSPV